MTTKSILNYLKVLGCIPKQIFLNLLPNFIQILTNCDKKLKQKFRRKFRSCVEIYIHHSSFELISELLGADYQSLCTYIAREERRKKRARQNNAEAAVQKKKKKVAHLLFSLEVIFLVIVSTKFS